MNFCYFQQLAQTRSGGHQSLQLLFSDTKFKSFASKVETQITFVNTCDQIVKVQWLDFSGAKVHYLAIHPGQHYAQATFKSHPWVIFDYSDSKYCFFTTLFIS